jgi:hypothetical protein
MQLAELFVHVLPSTLNTGDAQVLESAEMIWQSASEMVSGGLAVTVSKDEFEF